MRALAECTWLRSHENCIITGPTGAGKSYLACAFGNQACRRDFTVRYFRAPRFFQELADAILDRLIHNAHTITLKGESMRKRKAT